MPVTTPMHLPADSDSDSDAEAKRGPSKHSGQNCFSSQVCKASKVTVAQYDSFYGPIYRLLDYKASWAWGPWALPQATVFGNATSQGSVLFCLLVALLIAFLGLCQANTFPYDCVHRTKEQLHMVVPFLIAGFATMQVGKWQKKRGNYGTLVGKTRDALTKVGAFIRADMNRPELAVAAKEARSLAGRYFCLALELSVMKSRGVMDDKEKSLPFLQEKELCAEAEWDRLIEGDRHTTVFFWLQLHVRECFRQGLLQETELRTMQETILGVRGSANDLLDLLPNGIPYIYSQLLGFVIRLYMVLVAMEMGFQMILDQHAFDKGKWKMHSVNGKPPPFYWFMQFFGLYMVETVFQSLVDLQDGLHNPFLDNLLGVPHEPIVYGAIHKLAKSMAEDENLPVAQVTWPRQA